MESRDSSNTNQGKKKGGTRKKIPIQLIADQNARHVCFSKRRSGLFKKAHELSVLCGADIAVLVSSRAGNPYSYISPYGSSSALHRFLPSSQHTNEGVLLPKPASDLRRQVLELKAKIESSKRRNQSLKEDLAQLEALKNDQEGFRVLSAAAGDNGTSGAVPEMGVGTSSAMSHPPPYPAVDSSVCTSTDAVGVNLAGRMISESEVPDDFDFEIDFES